MVLIASARSSRPDAGDNPAIEQSLVQMEHDWADAVMKNDSGGIDCMEAGPAHLLGRRDSSPYSRRYAASFVRRVAP